MSLMCDSETQALLLLRASLKKTTASTPLHNTSRPPNESVMMKSEYHTNQTRSVPHAPCCSLSTLSNEIVTLSIHFLTDVNTSPKKSRQNMTKRPRRGNMSTRRTRMRFVAF